MKHQDTVLHVINHTHWDREWFVPFTVTSRWIPSLIRNLGKVAHNNPGYTFLFDAQTMVIEDLEATDKESYKIAQRLIEDKKMEVGPYYAQLEMRMPGAETLVRNLRIGTAKAKSLHASTDFVAWTVDVFGHPSQTPQIHKMFGIKNAYMWRGPNQLAPFFWWKGADGTTMLAIDLFAGGYRNFYKVTSKARLAMPRLQHEVRKLRPFYKHGHIPVFDGFDLDREPGDAASYFAEYHAKQLKKDQITVRNSTPYTFAEAVRGFDDEFPTLKGELISGKYSSVFPGTLTSRVYSKVLSAHAEQLLYRYAEPINLLLPPSQYPEQLFAEQTKLVLQNYVHDVIAGCSIDQVHDTAELRAADVARTAEDTTQNALKHVAADLEDGTYAYLPGTGKTDTQVAIDEQLFDVNGDGVSVTKLSPAQALTATSRKVTRFTWQNRHYKATLLSGGTLKIGNGRFGKLVIRRDDGDTYWDEPRGKATALKIISPITVDRETDNYAELSFTAEAKTKDYSACVRATLVLDKSPLITWRLAVQTVGTGFSLALRHDYGRVLSHLNAGMAFDNVQRDFEDTDLLGRDLAPAMRSVLIGQRDIYQTFTFPFQSYVTPASNPDNVHLLAKGLRGYQTEQPGIIDLVLGRPVEWVMRPGLHKYHTGDAGPKFLVPGARGQRETVIECALLVDKAGPDSPRFHQLVDQFLNPPLVFQVRGSKGTKTRITLFDEDIPITTLHQYQGHRLVRTFNPTPKPLQLKQEQQRVTEDNKAAGTLSELSPKQIATCVLPSPAVHATTPKNPVTITLLNWPAHPVGPETSLKPSVESLTELLSLQATLKRDHDKLEAEIEALGSEAPSILLHRYYVIAREYMEANLTLKWNELRAGGTKPDEKYAFHIDKELYDMASQYNDMRIVRRMYDYIVDIDEKGLEEARPAHHAQKPTTQPETIEIPTEKAPTLERH